MPNKKHQTFSKDYKQLLSDDCMKNVDLIYADPPYSFVHYSRFYHAVESLVKYDYDIPMFKGRYRTDRHQSPFCQRQNVEKAFDTLFQGAKSNNANVLLSYSDTGMISLEKIREIIMNKGFTFEAEGIVYNHSTLGRKGHKNNKIQEYLVKAIIR
jgi:adenine-specific DNA-methyltransferase